MRAGGREWGPPALKLRRPGEGGKKQCDSVLNSVVKRPKIKDPRLHDLPDPDSLRSRDFVAALLNLHDGVWVRRYDSAFAKASADEECDGVVV